MESVKREATPITRLALTHTRDSNGKHWARPTTYAVFGRICLHAGLPRATTSFVDARFELFDHTADVGIRVFAPSMAGLIAPAGEGLYTVIGELTPGGERSGLRLEHTGDEPAVLLRDYLAELLFLFEDERRIVVSTDVHVFDEGRLVVEAQLAAVDETVSSYEREVKAITYHALEIAKLRDGFQATIIVDI